MRPSNSKVLNAASVASNQNSTPLLAVDILRCSAQAVVTGSPNGTLKLQFSNDQAVGLPPNQFVPTNWSDLGSAVAIAAAGVFVIPYTETSYEYLRLVYTDSSSGSATGTITARMATKGL